DAVEPVAGEQPGFVLRAIGPDIERDHVTFHAMRTDSVEDAVVRRRLLDQGAGGGVDVVEAGFLRALHRVDVGAGGHLRHFALVDVRIGELQLPVFRHLAVVDVDAQVGSVAADQPHAVGNGIEVDRGPAADRQHDLELRFQGGFAGRGVDRVDAAV